MNIHGIELSNFPESVDVEKYPYQMIVKEESDGETAYRALLTSKPIYYNPTSKIYEIDEPYDFVIVALYEENPSEVVSQGNSESVDGNVLLGVMALAQMVVSAYAYWINYDVLNNDTGEIHLKSYDGVLLPPLPSDIDRTVYPYASVFKLINTSANLTMYMFVVTDVPTQYSVEKGYWLQGGTKMTAGMLQTIENGWENVFAQVNEADMYFNEGMEGFETTLIWSESPSTKYYLFTESEVKDIADSIRRKTGKTDKIQKEEFSSEIDGISSGGESEDSLAKFKIVKPLHDKPNLLTEVFTIEKGE